MKKGGNFYIFFLAFSLSAFAVVGHAQTPTDSVPKDPGGIIVYTIQNLSFGAFTRGNNGGTLSISPSGARVATGDIIPLSLGYQFYYAIFDVESPPGNIISILYGPPVILNGSNGGSITLNIGGSDPTTPFINYATPPNRTQINIGGALTIGPIAAAPPGNYSGTFFLTFNQE